MTTDKKTDILLGLFVGAIIAANFLGNKITTIFGVSVSVAIFSYPLTFLITDIVSEVHGKKKSYNFLIAGASAIILTLILTIISLKLEPNKRFVFEDEYQTIFGLSVRMLIASLTAFALSQVHDIWSFHFWRQKTQGNFLWLRNNASTIVSQFIDTSVFMFIAFYHAFPGFNIAKVFSLIIPYWLFKLGIALIDTPLCYLGVKWLKNKK